MTSTPRELTVTNVFDEYDNLLTGAKNKADRNAVKTWKFRKVEVKSGKFSYANMGAYGGWKYTSAGYTPESDFIWWANITDAELGDKVNWRMEFSYNGNKFTLCRRKVLSAIRITKSIKWCSVSSLPARDLWAASLTRQDLSRAIGYSLLMPTT